MKEMNDEYEEDEESEWEDAEMEEDELESSELMSKKSSNKLLPSSDGEDDSPVKSNHKVAQERLAKKISTLEENAVGAKHWQVGGEVAASVRPENSLLAEHLEYETAARHAPVVTEDAGVGPGEE